MKPITFSLLVFIVFKSILTSRNKYNHISLQLVPLVKNATLDFKGDYPLVIKTRPNFTKSRFHTESHTTVDLENILSILQKSEGTCHVLVDNYQNSDIIASNYPISLRNSNPVHFRFKDIPITSRFAKRHPGSIVWFPTNICDSAYRNGTTLQSKINSREIQLPCPTTTNVLLLTKSPRWTKSYDTCVRFDKFKLSSESKPWVCEIHISMFVPEKYLKLGIATLSPFWYHVPSPTPTLTGLKVSPPSSQSKIKILVQKQVYFEDDHFPNVERWIEQSTNSDRYLLKDIELNDRPSLIRYEEYFVTYILPRKKLIKSKLELEIFKIGGILRVVVTPELAFYNENITINSKILYTQDENILSPRIEKDIALWNIHTYNFGSSSLLLTLSRHVELITSCTGYLKLNKKLLNMVNPQYRNPEDKLASGIVSLWMSSFKNLTLIKQNCFKHIYSPDWTKKVTLGLLLEFSSSEKASSFSLVYPTVLPDVFHDLRFVSCGGSNGLDAVSGLEFVNVYKILVWIFILLSIIAVTSSINSVNTSKNDVFLESADMVIKVLLEQGNPFKEKVFSNKAVRHIAVCYMFAAIVLSNAYKNTNVYNLIAPRQPVPYSKISELTRDNFTILTGTESINIDALSVAFEWIAYKGKFQRSHSLFVRYGHFLHSSNFYLTIDGDSYVKKLQNQNQILVDNTRLHPALGSEATKLFQKYFESWNVTEIYKKTFSTAKMSSVIRQKEENMLDDFMQKCNKTALVLPHFVCNKKAIKLQQFHLQSNIYVGTEMYQNHTEIPFQINGWVHPNVLRRFESLKTSGLIDALMRSVSESKIFTPGHRHTKTPDMSGNVQVIFFVLLAGWLITVFVFVAEIATLILKLIWMTINRVVMKFSPLVKTLRLKIPSRMNEMFSLSKKFKLFQRG